MLSSHNCTLKQWKRMNAKIWKNVGHLWSKKKPDQKILICMMIEKRQNEIYGDRSHNWITFLRMLTRAFWRADRLCMFTWVGVTQVYIFIKLCCTVHILWALRLLCFTVYEYISIYSTEIVPESKEFQC